MGYFEKLLDRARPAVKEAISEVDPGTFNSGFAIADVSLSTMEDLVPEDVDVVWCVAMLNERPELLKESADGDTLADVVRSAVIELALTTLDPEMNEYAVELGIKSEPLPTP